MPARYSYIQGSRSPINITWLPEFIAGSAVSPFHSSQMVVAPLLDHVAPARDSPSAWRSARPGRAAVVGEHAHQLLPADQTGPHVRLDSTSILRPGCSNSRGALLGRCQAKGKRQEAGGLRAVVVDAPARLEEPLVESGFHPLGIAV